MHHVWFLSATRSLWSLDEQQQAYIQPGSLLIDPTGAQPLVILSPYLLWWNILLFLIICEQPDLSIGEKLVYMKKKTGTQFWDILVHCVGSVADIL